MTAVDGLDDKRPASGVRGWERDRREAGANRRSMVARAVADLIIEIGPAAITHRKVAARAEASLSATSYYFKDLTALMGAGAALVFTDWSSYSAVQAEELTYTGGPIDDGATALMRVIFPPGDIDAVRRQFELLTMVHRLTGCDPEFDAMQGQLTAATTTVLSRLKLIVPPPAAAVVATVLGFGLQESSQRLAPMTLAPTLREWLAHYQE